MPNFLESMVVCYKLNLQLPFETPHPAERTFEKKQNQGYTTVGIRWWSPTQLLIYRSEGYVWQSGRDAQFSSVYGRIYEIVNGET
jgi:hypothetical protein